MEDAENFAFREESDAPVINEVVSESDLLVNVSAPVRVLSVPLVGRITEVVPVTVMVVAKEPEVIRFPPRVIVLPVLAIPVPPYCPAITEPFHTPVPSVPTLVNDDETIPAGREVPVNKDVGTSPADNVPTVVNEELTILTGRVVPVKSETGTAPADNVPTVVMLDRLEVEISVPLVGRVTEVGPVAVNVTDCAPTVTSDELLAKVSVAAVAGSVIVTLLRVVAVPFPTAIFRVVLSTKSPEIKPTADIWKTIEVEFS
jgi:hypothetical protein